jgi:hypothetical protein
MKKRVFSNNNIISYSDYLRNKILSCKKPSFFDKIRFCDIKNTCNKPPITIIQGTTSFICNKHIKPLCNNFGTLYPYGHYLCKGKEYKNFCNEQVDNQNSLNNNANNVNNANNANNANNVNDAIETSTSNVPLNTLNLTNNSLVLNDIYNKLYDIRSRNINYKESKMTTSMTN